MKYCSTKCAGAARSALFGRVSIECARCGKRAIKRRDHLTRYKKQFCSAPCARADRRIDGAKWRDPEYIKAYMIAYAANNRARINELSRQWGANNRPKKLENERRRRSSGSITNYEWRAILDRYGNKCLACGATDRLEADHVVSVVAGGLGNSENIQPLCRPCNARKGARTIDYRPDRRVA